MPVKNSKIIEKNNLAKQSKKESVREKITSKEKKSTPSFSTLTLPDTPKIAVKKDLKNDNFAKNASKTQKNSKKSAKNEKMTQNLSRDDAQNEFVALLEKLNKSADKRAFIAKIKNSAEDGDSVAQDFMAYLYKSGYERIVPENFSKQIRYEILAGAGGNEFAINKLQFYFNYALDQIVYDDQFNLICFKLHVNENNYLNIFCKFICEALVKQLAIDPKVLSEEKDVFAPYRPETFRDFRRAIDEVLPKLLEEWKN